MKKAMHFPSRTLRATKKATENEAHFYLNESKRFISRHSIANYCFSLRSYHRRIFIRKLCTRYQSTVCVCRAFVIYFIALCCYWLDNMNLDITTAILEHRCCYSFLFQFGANALVFVSHLLVACRFSFLLHSFQFWFSRALWLPDVKAHFYHHLLHAVLCM